MTNIGKWMKKEVVVIEKDATVIEAIHLMKEKKSSACRSWTRGKLRG